MASRMACGAESGKEGEGMIGQSYSTSLNACVIRFHGGPYDGQEGLFDHLQFQSISFCDPTKKVTHEYKPDWSGDYAHARTYKWKP